MLETYQAYVDYRDVMDMLEDMVAFVINEISGDLNSNENIIDHPPWQRLT